MKKENVKKEKMTLGKLAMLIEKLAGFTINGFEEIRIEMKEVKTEMKEVRTEMKEVRTEVATVKATVAETEDRVRKIERSVMRVESEMITPLDIEDLLGRVSYIERKLGIESGKRQ